MSNSDTVTLRDVIRAAERIRQHVHRTPVVTSQTIDGLASSPEQSLRIVMKCENLQKVGAFKIRGATNAVVSLLESTTEEPSSMTVVTHSSGNHAQALALASRQLGVKCQVAMPSTTPSVKKAAVKGYGAIVTECEPTLEARESTANRIRDEIERTSPGKSRVIPPYDDPRVIAGQGTAALELLEQAKEIGRPLDVLITPVGGGGLLSGCALTAKGLDPTITVIGAEPLGAADAYRSFTSKTLQPSIEPKTIADGLLTSLGNHTFPLILKHVDGICTVTETQIILATQLVFERLKLVIEPSAAVPLAVVLYSTEFRRKMATVAQAKGSKPLNVGLVFSGGNVDLITLVKLFEGLGNKENE